MKIITPLQAVGCIATTATKILFPSHHSEEKREKSCQFHLYLLGLGYQGWAVKCSGHHSPDGVEAELLLMWLWVNSTKDLIGVAEAGWGKNSLQWEHEPSPLLCRAPVVHLEARFRAVHEAQQPKRDNSMGLQTWGQSRSDSTNLCGSPQNRSWDVALMPVWIAVTLVVVSINQLLHIPYWISLIRVLLWCFIKSVPYTNTCTPLCYCVES